VNAGRRGRVYAVMSSQQGAYSPSFGHLNIEVTMTGDRGWVDEPIKSDIWFSPSN
jgi:hypothetical protein